MYRTLHLALAAGAILSLDGCSPPLYSECDSYIAKFNVCDGLTGVDHVFPDTVCPELSANNSIVGCAKDAALYYECLNLPTVDVCNASGTSPTCATQLATYNTCLTQNCPGNLTNALCIPPTSSSSVTTGEGGSAATTATGAGGASNSSTGTMGGMGGATAMTTATGAGGAGGATTTATGATTTTATASTGTN